MYVHVFIGLHCAAAPEIYAATARAVAATLSMWIIGPVAIASEVVGIWSLCRSVMQGEAMGKEEVGGYHLCG